MENYNVFVKGINTYLISGIFISILFITLIRFIFKNKIDTHYALNSIRWLLIIYSGLALIGFILMIIFPNPQHYFPIDRATGPYAWAFWTMTISNILLPFLLLIKTLGRKTYFLVFVSIFINIGMWFERFVIILTSLHRDYLPQKINFDNSIGYILLILISNWIIIGLLFLVGGNLYKYFKAKRKVIN